MIPLWHISNLLTYMGIVSSVVGMCFAVAQRPGLATVFLILTGLCDLFDGEFARRFKRTDSQRNFGVQIDSLADVLGFGALPVMILFAAGLNEWYFWPVLAIYAICAASRLAYFNTEMSGKDTSVSVSNFVGLPVTYSALVWPLVWLLSYTLAPQVFRWVLSVTALVLAVLFVLNFKNRKPRGVFYTIFGVSAILVAAILLYLELVF